MDPDQLKDEISRLGAQYRSLPTDELLGELRNIQDWVRSFLSEAQEDGNIKLGQQGLMLVVPFMFEIMDALYPKLEVLYGIHPITPKDGGKTRGQMVKTMMALFEKKVP